MKNKNPVDKVKIEEAKKVATYDVDTKEKNGFVIELFKEGKKTTVYMSAISPGGFKGYHEHKIRAGRYVCLKGKVKIILYVDGKREEYILSADKPQRLYIPPNIPNGLENIGKEEAWLINFPLPAYDPDLKDEQIDYAREEIER
jgi:dTDP-4-dehydrorhamnose 3,5-epimerase-like enzyme